MRERERECKRRENEREISLFIIESFVHVTYLGPAAKGTNACVCLSLEFSAENRSGS